uniref:Uncharacterized protein n=1 Tax=Rhizophagus irregularis (strain DAOM 181602 / DAOM 197198 / MUCL 43194) TaxID=747089 RepID=U9U392_RHIID
MHSKINFWSLEDSRINTLKEIQNWFVYDNKQKTESKGWISSQCQFDLILSINGFLRILKYLLSNYPGSIVQPKRISQDILEGLFGVIHEFGVDSSTHTLKSYGYALNKYQITALVSFEVKSVNYGKDSTGTGITTLVRSEKTMPNSLQIHLSADPHLIPEKTIVLEPAEASKFSYIVGWIIYKLTKSDNITKSHSEFEAINIYLMILNSEQVVYEEDIQSQTTNVISGQEENLKAMRKDIQHSTKIENNKHTLMKKSNIPTNPTLGLRKKGLIPLILDYLKKETPFSEEAISKGQIFVEK